MAARWHCKIGDEVLGPLTSQQLVDLARRQRLLPEHLVRKGHSGWVPAKAVKGLFEKSDTGQPDDEDVPPAPPQPQSQSDSLPRARLVSRPPHPPDASSESLLEALPIDDETADGPTADSGIFKALLPGSVLGNYLLLEVLGKGGMGVVLKARHRRMDRVVALKVLPADATGSPEAIRRFQQEVRAAARLVHPHIVTAYDADEAGGLHFLVMEYVDGTTLSDLIARQGPLPIRDAVNYVLQAARGLAYAHAEGVVHRDIKPGNLLVDKRGHVKILDMGLARVEETAAALAEEAGSDSLTRVGQVLGTLDYMAPEQAEDARLADRRADIYSLGCTFFRLLTGRPPYAGKTAINKVVAHRNQPIPSLVEARKGVPADLDAVFRRMVAKEPADRYPSMDELIADLESFLATGSVRRASGAWTSRPSTSPSSSGILRSGGSFLLGREPAVHIPSGDDSDSFQLAPAEEDTPRPAASAPTERPQAESWFCLVMGEELGPLSLGQLLEMKRKKQITPADMVRPSDRAQWHPASDVPGLF